jgi:septal ring factor EnvC (AmiA/AmiB activator)
MAEQNKPMTKWITMAVVAVVVVALAVMTIVLAVQNSSLKKDLDETKTQVTTLQGQVSTLQSNASTLQTQLNQSQTKSTSLQTTLDSANKQVESLNSTITAGQTTIASQANQIKTMKYPRHFDSVTELTNWLQKDDTNTKYTGLSNSQISFILQIRAAREGYLLPVRLPIGGSLDYITNMAIIGDSAYSVRGTDDFVEKWITISPVMPSYPITPESGQ